MKNILDDKTIQYRLKYVLQIEDKDKSIAQADRDAGVAINSNYPSFSLNIPFSTESK